MLSGSREEGSKRLSQHINATDSYGGDNSPGQSKTECHGVWVMGVEPPGTAPWDSASGEA